MALNSMSKVEGVGMPGMVGFETFRRFVTRVDYGAGTITLIKQAAFDPKDAGTAIPVRVQRQQQSMRPRPMYGVKGTFTIDTGSRASLTLNGPFVARKQARRDGQERRRGDGLGRRRADAVGRAARRHAHARRDAHRCARRRAFHRQGRRFRPRHATSGNIGSRRAQALRRHARLRAHDDVPEGRSRHRWPTSTPSIAPACGSTKAARVTRSSTVTRGTPAESGGFQGGRRDHPGTVVTFAVKGKGDVKVTLRDLI